MEKLIIIGAGISGLTAGIYGRMNGFETEVYEMHTIPGGECTGWKREGYYFDGCIHWLIGTKEGTSLNKIWKKVGALNSKVSIINHDIFYSYEENGQCVNLYRDARILRNHLLEVAPDDRKMIKYLYKSIKALKCIEMPTEVPFDMMNGLDIIKMMVKMFPGMKYLMKLEKITIQELADQFHTPILRNALTKLIPPHYKATALISTLASMADGDSGWPEGGSLQFAKRVEERYKSLGGKVFYKSKVKKVLIRDGKAIGIELVDGTKHYSDYVISSADGHATLYDMLEGKYLNENLKTLYSDHDSYPTYTSVQVSLGVDCDLSNYTHTRFIKLNDEIDGGGISNQYLGFRHLCFDKKITQHGKSSLMTMLYADFDLWNNVYSDNEAYNLKKKSIADEVKAIAEKHYPEIKNKIQVVDVATPMTYVRYCNAWKGAWMSWATTPKGKIRFVPAELPGLNNFYLAGQWTLPPGGLPTAVVTGRWIIQKICRLNNQKFITDYKVKEG